MYGEQYLVNSSSSATLVFLPGDHNLKFTISVGTLFDFKNESFTSKSDSYQSPSSLTLLGSPSSLPGITSRIVCTWPAGFIFSGITELHITALAFISCGHNDSAAINILSVWNIYITNCSFQNNTNNRSGSGEYGFGGAIYVHGSNLTLAENTFQHNFARKGGALEVFTNNTVILSRNIFLNNSASHGGSLYAHGNNTLTLSGNRFQGNSANNAGGALYADTDNTLFLSENTFQNNSAKFGGTVYVYANNNLTLSGYAFWYSSAEYGGALRAYTNNALTLSGNKFQDNSAEFGGALAAYANNTLTLLANTLQDNSANYGGAHQADVDNTVTLLENTFHNNSAC